MVVIAVVVGGGQCILVMWAADTLICHAWKGQEMKNAFKRLVLGTSSVSEVRSVEDDL